LVSGVSRGRKARTRFQIGFCPVNCFFLYMGYVLSKIQYLLCTYRIAFHGCVGVFFYHVISPPGPRRRTMTRSSGLMIHLIGFSWIVGTF
jgi:hypothetical protein